MGRVPWDEARFACLAHRLDALHVWWRGVADVESGDVNFFHNDFDERLGKALFSGHPSRIDDVSTPDVTSAGDLPKRWVIGGNGVRSLIKGGRTSREPDNDRIAYRLAGLSASTTSNTASTVRRCSRSRVPQCAASAKRESDMPNQCVKRESNMPKQGEKRESACTICRYMRSHGLTRPKPEAVWAVVRWNCSGKRGRLCGAVMLHTRSWEMCVERRCSTHRFRAGVRGLCGAILLHTRAGIPICVLCGEAALHTFVPRLPCALCGAITLHTTLSESLASLVWSISAPHSKTRPSCGALNRS